MSPDLKAKTKAMSCYICEKLVGTIYDAGCGAHICHTCAPYARTAVLALARSGIRTSTAETTTDNNTPPKS